MSSFISQKPLILASGSISRQKLLSDAGLKFDIHLSNVDEDKIKKDFQDNDFEQLALTLAKEKALVVSTKYPDIAVIAADQLCVLGHEIFDKPLSHTRAQEQLKELNGKKHRLLTAVCVAKEGQILWSYLEPVYLTMRHLSDQTIEHYLNLETPYNSCGSYHFEGRGKWLFEDVSEHESTIIGLPILPLFNALIEFDLVSI